MPTKPVYERKAIRFAECDVESAISYSQSEPIEGKIAEWRDTKTVGLTLRITPRNAVWYVGRREISLRLGLATEIGLDDARYFAEQTRLAAGRKRDLREFVNTLVSLETDRGRFKDRRGHAETADSFADESSLLAYRKRIGDTGRRGRGFDILPASQRISETNWYLGTADAVYQNIDIIEPHRARFVVLLAGDHIYKMDYELMLRQHVEQHADVTIGCLEMPRSESSGFGIMHIDDHGVIQGIYVFDSKFLFDELRRDANDPNSSHDFGKDVIPYIVKNGRAVAHQFSSSCVRSGDDPRAYWRDVGTVDAYWAANIDLTDVLPELDLYDRAWPIWSYAEITPPAKFVHDEEGRRGHALTSLVSGGCIISGAALRRSLLFTGVQVNSFASVENAVVLPYVNVGRNPRLKNVVIDRGVRIPVGLVVGEDPELDAKRFRTTPQGISLITQPMIDSLGA